jgi:hypothetical protein
MMHSEKQKMDERTAAWIKALALTLVFASVLGAAGPAYAANWTKPLDLVLEILQAIFAHPVWHALFGALVAIALVQYANSKNLAYIGGAVIVSIAWIAWGAREEFFG